MTSRSLIEPPTSAEPLARVYLSPPDVGARERALVAEAFDSNWVAPLGPHVDAFEQEMCAVTGSRGALALSSGTAALHLALQLAGVGPGDSVVVSDLTFVASVNPIRYVGATPVFVDSERTSWNMDSAYLREALTSLGRRSIRPKAIVLVHLYGQSADLDAICGVADDFGIPIIEDAAEALGTRYRGIAPGTRGMFGILSFNGNKMITTSGGGMLLSNDLEALAHARKLATQAREPAPHYEHAEVGYNYRLSNVLAAIGRGQLESLEQRVAARREHFAHYERWFSTLPGVDMMPEAPWGRHSRWLTVVTIDPDRAGVSREDVRLALERENIEARPLWKPMHLQPLYATCECHGGHVSEELFDRGLCLPSGSNLTPSDRDRVTDVVRSLWSTA